MKRLRLAVRVVLAGILATISEPGVYACITVPRAGDRVHISEESALIVWDAASKTEHFIRRAKFDTKAKDFGFLVPTPTRPSLSEVDDAVFAKLLDLTRPPARYVSPEDRAAEKAAAAKAAAEKSAPVVTVLETKTVAGFDAAVIASNDAHALNAWLKKNAYASSPELTEWLKPYLAGGWIITAFKISNGRPGAGRAVTTAVRMSFKTERPFFPYREPAVRDQTSRALELYFLSGERVEGRIGGDSAAHTGERPGNPWPGRPLWARPLDRSAGKDLLKRVKLPEDLVPKVIWLTRFLDSSAPRPGTDELYFSRAKDQNEIVDVKRLYGEIERKDAAARAAANARLMADVRPSKPEPLADSPTDTDPVLLLKKGKDAEDQGDAKTAIKLYRQAYRNSSGEAAKRIGDIYAAGKGNQPRDYAEGLVWHMRAERLGVVVGRTPSR